MVVFAIGGLGVQRFSWWFAVVATGWLAACSITPRAGPQADEAIETLKQPAAAGSVQIVNVDASVVRSQLARRHQETFSETLANGEPPARPRTIGAGDVLDVTLWEAPPATLFGNAPIDPRNPSTVRSTTLPEQVVDQDGSIRVPFAGSIKVRGLTLEDVQAEIVQRLRTLRCTMQPWDGRGRPDAFGGAKGNAPRAGG